jgi:hypothetical protein
MLGLLSPIQEEEISIKEKILSREDLSQVSQFEDFVSQNEDSDEEKDRSSSQTSFNLGLYMAKELEALLKVDIFYVGLFFLFGFSFLKFT